MEKKTHRKRIPSTAALLDDGIRVAVNLQRPPSPCARLPLILLPHEINNLPKTHAAKAKENTSIEMP